jgi:hypothetical protein
VAVFDQLGEGGLHHLVGGVLAGQRRCRRK